MNKNIHIQEGLLGSMVKLEKYVLSTKYSLHSEPIEENAAQAYRNIVNAAPELLREVVLYIVTKLENYSFESGQLVVTREVEKGWSIRNSYFYLLYEILVKNIPFEEDEYLILFYLLSSKPVNYHYTFSKRVLTSIFRMFAKQYKAQKLSDELKKCMEDVLQSSMVAEFPPKEKAAFIFKIKEVLDKELLEEGSFLNIELDGSDNFGLSFNGWISSISQADQQAWFQLLGLCQKAEGLTPSNKFLNTVKSIIAANDPISEHIIRWLWILAEEKSNVRELDTTGEWRGSFQLMPVKNQIILKGIIWAASTIKTDETIAVMNKLANIFFISIRGIGLVAPAMGNACCWALSQSDNPVAFGHLSELKAKVHQPSAKKIIDRFIVEAAQRKGLTKGDLEDEGISDYGLVQGQRRLDIGDYYAGINLLTNSKPSLNWYKKDGTPLKSVPSVIKEQYATALKEAKVIFNAIAKSLGLQRQRFERFYLEDRSWRLARFEAKLLQQGLVGHFVKRMIWHFKEGTNQGEALWKDEAWRNTDGEKLDWLGPDTTVRLWHPALSKTETTLAWRSALERWQVMQPFKQAYREIYLLTEAELNTRTYSNRMAAHIVRQHQLSSLAKGRGWKHNVVGGWDHGGNLAELDIPAVKMRVEFWLEDMNDEANFANSYVYLHVGTDQVRLYKQGDHEPMPLNEVPPVIFSEIMRDVDLFVGVASVGNDPTWHDRGDQRFQHYWHTYSFGDLGEMAKTRKVVLGNILPKLKIAKVAQIQDKFLVIKGKRRTYKIHIGSTNILMEPNDQYLCIVEKRSADAPSNIFLPFEGDHGLAVLLSKAFLLAADDKITDPTILSQLERR